MTSPNFRSSVLLFQVFCDKNVGLMTIVLMPVLDVQATRDTAFVIHSLNTIVLYLPASVEASLQGLPSFLQFSRVHFKI